MAGTRFQPTRAGIVNLWDYRDEEFLFVNGWLVLRGQIYYIGPRAVGPSDVHVLDPISGNDRILTTIPNSIADFNFSVSHDGGHIVVVRVAAQDTDVGAVTLRHVRGD